MNKYRLALERIILYLNATEPTGKYIKDIELLLKQNKLLKLYKDYKQLKDTIEILENNKVFIPYDMKKLMRSILDQIEEVECGK